MAKRRTPGKLLRAWRTETGTSQAVAAKAVGVRQNTWSDWENDRKNPQIERALRIAEVTGGRCPVEAWARSERKAA
jgi:DNA-binding XRE family transcriptional regulator